jgi:lipoprotein-releasing system ATP-binding protein
MKEILKAKNLHKYFYEPDEFHVLNDISLSVKKGEFVAITGKSGCGKSTLMYLLATLDTDYAGSIEINCTKITGLKQNELARFRNEHIGFVFQYHFLLPEFTALQNIMIPALKAKKMSARHIKESAMAMLGQVRMENLANHLSSKLSGGQQQRVAILRALINNPDIIMADEPTGNLDSVNSEIILNIFRDLVDKGNTIIAVTHDKDFAKKADRVVEMKDGMIQSR